MSPPCSALKNRIAWNGFALTLPDEWEVVGHQLDPKLGEFRLSKRLKPCGQISWRHVPNPRAHPDLTHEVTERHRAMIAQRAGSAQRSPQRAASAQPALSELADKHGWLVSAADPLMPRQAVRWFADRHLVVLVIVEPTVDEADFMMILASWQTREDTMIEHALYGLRVILPATWQVERVVAQPGSVRLIARGPGLMTLTARRIALARHLLAGTTVGDFFTHVLRAEGASAMLEGDDGEALVLRGCPAARLTFQRGGEFGWRWLRGRWWTGTAWVWHDAPRNRLYSIEQIGPARTAQLTFDEIVPVDHV